MNVLPIESLPPADLWERPEIRAVLAAQDIRALYQHLRKHGVSQRRIAQLTGQHHSDVTDVAGGRRQIQSYDVLVRIATGLGIPRGYMGLAHSDRATHDIATSPRYPTFEGNPMQRRDFLGLISKIVMGAALTPAEVALLAGDPHPTPVPQRVGATDVDRLRALTSGLRAYDVEHGGGACRDAVLAQMRWAESLKSASYSDDVRGSLFNAVAELKTLAGWTSHDLALTAEAYRYLGQAVEDTRIAGDPAHTAIVLHHLGRVPLDNDEPDEAIKYFQLGQISAQDSSSFIAVSFLHANEAVAYAHQNDQRKALTALRRAEDEYAHAESGDSAAFFRYFDRSALETATARVYSKLALTDATLRVEAVERLQRTVEYLPDNHSRQRAFNLTWLATLHLADGDTETGARIGNQAVTAARALNSRRILDHLQPLHEQTTRYQHADIAELDRDIRIARISG
nr:hypothetical protein [Kibdelosporangium sp. MJ126-NF4]CEL17613.1 Putative regulatory protein [Kibdelosporangium sp. MJ126-NF4]CTQ91159.1 regulator [Kibdelosporangium sp. MJ126-NF4]